MLQTSHEPFRFRLFALPLSLSAALCHRRCTKLRRSWTMRWSHPCNRKGSRKKCCSRSVGKRNQGSLFLGVPLTEKGGTASPQYILNDSLPYGVGQNDLGLDRGQISIFSGVSLSGSTRLVHFERVGNKLLLVQENTNYRTASTDPAERLAVQQSFPSSVLAGFVIS